MSISVKICGLSTPESVAAAVDGGADMVGFVLFAASPRAVTPEQLPGLVEGVPPGVTRVGLFVDATDDEIAATVNTGCLDMLQLHGQETPGRVAQIKLAFGLPVMKAVAIATAEDVEGGRLYEAFADRLLFDATAPDGASRPGGNAEAFDWNLLSGAEEVIPWMLAGGLNMDNLARAVRVTGATAVDVSSGVEDAPGVKNPAKIREFLALAASL